MITSDLKDRSEFWKVFFYIVLFILLYVNERMFYLCAVRHMHTRLLDGLELGLQTIMRHHAVSGNCTFERTTSALNH